LYILLSTQKICLKEFFDILQLIPKGVISKMQPQELEIYVYTVDGEKTCANCECGTCSFVPTAARAWTAASMGPLRNHSARGPLAPAISSLPPIQMILFIGRASLCKCRFTLAYMRLYALETKERMLMYLHALERLNRFILPYLILFGSLVYGSS
jgi:hypothetical protein